ncbi:2TM domain-containing protein [Planctomicrobium sp. SH664]|uniref:2TM domain-containing protein n=1 Tax=Planctomicrobium sp. SH664 TaxID=3448125 RepID=UPI003F5C1B92
MNTTHHTSHDPIASQAQRGFFIHAGIYVGVMCGLAFLNFRNNPDNLWFLWPLAGWGLGVIAHGIQAYRLPEPMRQRIAHRMERREARKEHREARRG